MSVGFENQLLQVAESPDDSAVHMVRAESSVRIEAFYFHLVLVYQQNLFNKKHVHLSLKCKTSAICDLKQDIIGQDDPNSQHTNILDSFG